jgi:hypothetical protein
MGRSPSNAQESGCYDGAHIICSLCVGVQGAEEFRSDAEEVDPLAPEVVVPQETMQTEEQSACAYTGLHDHCHIRRPRFAQ